MGRRQAHRLERLAEHGRRQFANQRARLRSAELPGYHRIKTYRPVNEVKELTPAEAAAGTGLGLALILAGALAFSSGCTSTGTYSELERQREPQRIVTVEDRKKWRLEALVSNFESFDDFLSGRTNNTLDLIGYKLCAKEYGKRIELAKRHGSDFYEITRQSDRRAFDKILKTFPKAIRSKVTRISVFDRIGDYEGLVFLWNKGHIVSSYGQNQRDQGIYNRILRSATPSETKHQLEYTDVEVYSRQGAGLILFPELDHNDAFIKDTDIVTYYKSRLAYGRLTARLRKDIQKRLDDAVEKAKEAGPSSHFSKEIKRVKKWYPDTNPIKVRSLKDFVEAIKSVGEANGGISFLYLGAHGERNTMHFADGFKLKATDLHKPEIVALRKYIKGPVCLASCSTAAGSAWMGSVAKTLSVVWQAEVHAPITVACTKLTDRLNYYATIYEPNYLHEYTKLDFSAKKDVYEVTYEKHRKSGERFVDGKITPEHRAKYHVRLNEQGKITSIFQLSEEGSKTPYVVESQMTKKQKKALAKVKSMVNNVDRAFFNDFVQAGKDFALYDPVASAVYKNGVRVK